MVVTTFPEAAALVDLLAAARRAGRNFDHAWSEAIARVRRGREGERWTTAKAALEHHRDAWRRAYYREPRPHSMPPARSSAR